MTVHDLKIYPEYFAEVIVGNKPFEIRKNDRNFKTGDLVVLHEYDPISRKLTGDKVKAEITYMTDYEQKENYVVMGIKITPVPESN